ncbi:(2Fe-2S)-binding protein [Pseudonocardia spinosispora]|uniref:(2Fe-2S)-binding protein n=1 Tax=Pseudonocardia spinosispora TaxID=103441 RepID=UPI00041FA28F|nr:(2Fe-2S)-binding protein [Pseudonocardia spinosispora]
MREAHEPAPVRLIINGRAETGHVTPRTTLADLLRHELGLTGTHLGCEQGVCGACTVLLDDLPVRSCLTLAVQAEGARVDTVEGLAGGDMHPLQEKFWKHQALQCGFCTPGFLMAAVAAVREAPAMTRDEIRARLSGNICRCTGYQPIIDAVAEYSAELGERGERS